MRRSTIVGVTILTVGGLVVATAASGLSGGSPATVPSAGKSALAGTAPSTTSSPVAAPSPVGTQTTTVTPTAKATPAPSAKAASTTTPAKAAAKPSSAKPAQPKQSPAATSASPKVVNGILLVSKKYPLPASYKPARTAGAWGLTPEANAAVNKLIAAARKDGVPMKVRSGYRSYATQKALYERALRTYPSVAQAKRFNAPAGASEHQTGLAVDMWDGQRRGWAFRGTPTDKWLAKNAHKYGFIIRYPKGKESVTGYHDEPWHLRYVGTAVSSKFGPGSTRTLEEYLGVR